MVWPAVRLGMRLTGWGAVAVGIAWLGVVPTVLALSDLLRNGGAEAMAALSDGVLWERLVTTAWILAGTLALVLPIGLAQAWLFARTDLPGARWMRVLAPLPLFVPPLVHVLTWFGWFRLTGMVAIVMVYAISFTPLVAVLAARTLDAISREQAETWRLLGGRRAVLIAELRQAWPAGLIGCALTIAFVLADFAVADFLSSVGPKVTVYADTLYLHHLGLRPGAVAGVALPGLVVTVGILAWGLRARRRLAVAVGSRFESAPRVALGAWRWPAAGTMMALLALGSVVPVVSLVLQAGSVERLVEQANLAWPAVRASVFVGALAALGMVAVALPMALITWRWPRRWRVGLDWLVALPLAVPPLVYGVGLVRLWNHPVFDAIYLSSAVVIVALIGRYLAFALLPIQGALERIDPRLDEAARLAGAGAFDRLRTVMLPLLWRPIAVAMCLAYGFTLREIDVLVMLRAGQSTLPWQLYSNVVFAQPADVAALAAILTVITVAPLLVVMAWIRHPVDVL